MHNKKNTRSDSSTPFKLQNTLDLFLFCKKEKTKGRIVGKIGELQESK